MATKKKVAKRAPVRLPAKKAAKTAPSRRAKASAGAAGGVAFNHAMIYTRDVARSAAFYRDALGLRVIDEYPGAYARLVSPGGTTLALHCLEPGQQLVPSRSGVRLYFEVKELDAFCQKLATLGVAFDQMPKDMPWGWRHAYLKDPDGHELSLYWAGAARLRATRMNSGDGD